MLVMPSSVAVCSTCTRDLPWNLAAVAKALYVFTEARCGRMKVPRICKIMRSSAEHAEAGRGRGLEDAGIL